MITQQHWGLSFAVYLTCQLAIIAFTYYTIHYNFVSLASSCIYSCVISIYIFDITDKLMARVNQKLAFQKWQIHRKKVAT